MGNRNCWQDKRTLFSSLLPFAQKPKFITRVKPNGLRYRRLGERHARKRKTAKVQNNLQKMPNVPAVRCTLCWAATRNHTSLLERQLPFVVALLCIFASRTSYPIHACNIMLPKHQTQLRSVFLNMPHTVQLKLQETGFHPLEYTTLLRSLVR